MTPKEKAEQLINAFIPHVRWKMGQEDVIRRAKECALIAVDEIIKEIKFDIYLTEYWKEVKQEIEKL
jgi:hypothetical protein